MNLFSISLILSGPAQSAIALTIFRTSGSLIEYPRKITGYSPKMVNILAMRYLAFIIIVRSVPTDSAEADSSKGRVHGHPLY